MNQDDRILIEFEQGDEEKRLYLFLAHRELRSDFMSIIQPSGARDARVRTSADKAS